jgi:hypothetical protein
MEHFSDFMKDLFWKIVAVLRFQKFNKHPVTATQTCIRKHPVCQ